MDNYILVDRIPVPCENLIEFGEWFQDANRHVGDTHVGEAWISTVFLGMDHSFTRSEHPILFETMIFGGKYDEFQRRYHTWNEAEKGHWEIYEVVFAPIKKKIRIIYNLTLCAFLLTLGALGGMLYAIT